MTLKEFLNIYDYSYYTTTTIFYDGVDKNINDDLEQWLSKKVAQINVEHENCSNTRIDIYLY